MQFSGLAKPPIGIVFDSALGDGIDDVLALSVIYALEAHSETRLVSTSTTKSSLRSAMFAEVLSRFLMGPPPVPRAGAFAGFQRPVPTIGMPDNGKLGQDTPVIQAVLDKKKADGTPVYARSIAKLNDTADPATLIRNALTAQHDGNCLVLLAGPATNLARTMALAGSMELIKAKVKCLLLSWGGDPEGAADASVKADVAAARQLLENWPTPILAVGSGLGTDLAYPGHSVGKDFTWADAHPVVDSYLAYRTMPYDAPAPSLAAVLHAIRPESGFTESPLGTISVMDDGRTRFIAGASGTHRYLMVDPARKAEILRTYVEIVSAKPLPRPMRRRPPEKKDEVPSPAAKPPDPAN
ncbi:hypothetical protein [uncultured Paludibaculum sp.]|uniref:hypothetical protein n=1 Tax=uncultured Paludibaculum sp. TaxID=1765020 RepID=UPI002AAAB2F9|nr:hypothetical protein [uncultured Paludibaculum sp.]